MRCAELRRGDKSTITSIGLGTSFKPEWGNDIITTTPGRTLHRAGCLTTHYRNIEGSLMYFHTFQGSCIPQSEIEQIIQGRVIPVGYVNATAMCKSAGKKPETYLRNKDTQARIAYVSSVALISVTELVFYRK